MDSKVLVLRVPHGCRIWCGRRCRDNPLHDGWTSSWKSNECKRERLSAVGVSPASLRLRTKQWLIRILIFLVLDCTYLVLDVRYSYSINKWRTYLLEGSNFQLLVRGVRIGTVVLWVSSGQGQVERVLFAEMMSTNNTHDVNCRRRRHTQ